MNAAVKVRFEQLRYVAGNHVMRRLDQRGAIEFINVADAAQTLLAELPNRLKRIARPVSC
jgi:hypothetical protein